MSSHIFHRFVGNPLFQGLSVDDFEQIAERVPFDFHTIAPGHTIVHADDPCDSLICTLSGTVCKEEVSDLRHYTFREFITTNTVIQPERLFGLRPRYSATFLAETEVQYFSVPKREVRDVLFTLTPFHLNYLNLLCTTQQLQDSRVWRALPDSLEGRFLHFLYTRSSRPAGQKELVIDMVALAGELTATRLRVSQMLNELNDRGLIELRRRHILIPSMEALLQHN